MVVEHAELLVRQRIFGNAVEMVQGCLCAPADVHGGLDVGLRPIKNLLQLVPIGHFFERHQLHGGTGDHKPVEFLMRHIRKVAVEGEHVFGRCVFRRVRRHLDERHLDLQRIGTEKAGELCFGADFIRHQVEQTNA